MPHAMRVPTQYAVSKAASPIVGCCALLQNRWNWGLISDDNMVRLLLLKTLGEILGNWQVTPTSFSKDGS